MKNLYCHYSFIIIISFVASLLNIGPVMAQTQDPYNYLPIENPQQMTNQQISSQSTSQDLTQPIAPPPLVITTSNGDLYLYQGDGLKAKYTVDQKGTDTITFFMEGSPFMQKNEFGEANTYQYTLDGTVVNLVNSQGGIVSTETYTQGRIMTAQSQGDITYTYDDKGAVISSVDNFGNVTKYANGKPVQILDSNGTVIGTYTYAGDYLSTFSDQYGNTTYFEDSGVRPTYTTNAEGTVTQVYHYNDQGNLDYVVNPTTLETTSVSNGYYTNIVNSEGETIGVYNYNLSGYAASLTSLGNDGTCTGWTEYDDLGRPIASYNGQGSLVQGFIYNDHGFLQQSTTYGAIDPVTQLPTILSFTLYDGKGRPAETWQHGDGENYVKAQTYEYNEKGVLSKTINYAIQRDANGEAVLDGDGQLIMVVTGYTVYDLRARPDAAYNEYGELQQRYVYGSDGFLTSTYSYGKNGAYTGKTDYDDYSRPNVSYNSYGSQTQLYTYGGDGFLTQTDNYATNGTWTGYSNYNNFGRPVQVFNQEHSLVQEYVYDQFGYLNRSNTYNKKDGEGNPVLTGYTQFDSNSRPITSYQLFDDGIHGTQVAKVQDYVYEDTRIIGYDTNQQPIYETYYTGFIVKTLNYGDNNTLTGYTVFDNFGRQDSSYNEYGVLQSRYNYNSEGFLTTTYNYGKDGAYTGQTIFDNYSRPVMSFNAYSSAYVTSDFINSLSKGVSEDVVNNLENQGMFRGLTQTFEYGTDGFLLNSKGWGEATELNVYSIKAFNQALGSVKGDANYNKAFDYNSDNAVDSTDLAIYDQSFNGIANLSAQLISGQATDADIVAFANALLQEGQSILTYQPTLLSQTNYDNFGKATNVVNAEGAVVQTYEYNERGFMTASHSLGVATDDQGNIIYQTDGNGNILQDAEGNNIPEYVETSRTLYNAASRPTETYQVYKDGVTAKIQEYVYDKGILIKTNNFGDVDTNGVSTPTGTTEFDAMGRQIATYNEYGQRTTSYNYSSQGFMNSTYNFGKDGAYTGQTLYDKSGRPVDSYNMYGDGRTNQGLTQTFTYNQYGMLSTSTSFGQNQAITGTTYFDGYGKALRVENTEGFAVTTYVYNERGFMDQTTNLAFVIDSGGSLTVTAKKPDGTTEQVTGYYVATGYTKFDAASRPTETYSLFNDGTNGEQEALVQNYVYDKGFLIQTNNFGNNGTSTGYTLFDSFGRQTANYNEYGEMGSYYLYSNQGFLYMTLNYGRDGAYLGKTTFSDTGKPVESYNQYSNNVDQTGLVQTFNYDVTGKMVTSTSYGEDRTITGTTYYDQYGKAQRATNAEGATISTYVYTPQGFMTQSNNWGEGGTLTGYTLFDDTSRPTSSYSVYNGVATKAQDFIYNKNVKGTTEDFALIGQTANTGFMTETINYGDPGDTGTNLVITGFTTFNSLGQQVSGYNELGELTNTFYYSNQGFMNMSYSWGINNAYMGKTLYDKNGRPSESYNTFNSLSQTFNYSNSGFLKDSISYGENQTKTGTTIYDAYGKQISVLNPENVAVQGFEYNSRGFLTQSINLAFQVDPNATGEWARTITLTDGTIVTGYYIVTGYTEYNALSRPTVSYSVYQDPVSGNTYTAKTSEFIYTKSVYDPQSQSYVNVATGFITASNSYALVMTDGEVACTDGMADAIGTEIVFSGKTIYDSFGRPSESYNQAGYDTSGNLTGTAQLTSRNIYSTQGFLQETYNYGENGWYSGKLTYTALGRPDQGYNQAGSLTTAYHYDNLGLLSYTFGYSGTSDGTPSGTPVVSSRTTYNIYSKPYQTFQYFKGTEGGNGGEYQFDFSGASANYTDADIANGTGGILTQTNEFTSFGTIKQSITWGRPTGDSGTQNIVSYTSYDTYQRPVEVYRRATDGSKVVVQEYVYSSTTGFLQYAVAKNDKWNEEKQQWESQDTQYTFYNGIGQQMFTYNDLEKTQLAAHFEYNSAGFLSKSYSYSSGTYTGYTLVDASGRQTVSYNYEGSLYSKYWYDINGFLTRTQNFQ